MRTLDLAIMAKLSEHRSECAIASPTWHELLYGVERLPAGKRRTDLDLYLRHHVRPRFPILDYNEDAAAWHAKERARLERSGRPTPFADGQIAAIAHVNKLVIVTRNTKDFARFRDVAVVDWSKSATTRN
jgi:tRNA(fMet)-specific endonuclease VapC